MWAIGIGDLQWYATARAEPREPLTFWVWDAEECWDATSGRSAAGYRYFHFPLFGALWKRAEFREAVRRRSARQCAPDGPLGERASIARWDRLAARLEPAILAEAARWGDEREAAAPRLADWRAAVDRVREAMRGNTRRMLEDLRERGILRELP